MPLQGSVDMAWVIQCASVGLFYLFSGPRGESVASNHIVKLLQDEVEHLGLLIKK